MINGGLRSIQTLRIEILPVVTLAMGLPLAGHSEVTSCSVLRVYDALEKEIFFWKINS